MCSIELFVSSALTAVAVAVAKRARYIGFSFILCVPWGMLFNIFVDINENNFHLQFVLCLDYWPEDDFWVKACLGGLFFACFSFKGGGKCFSSFAKVDI